MGLSPWLGTIELWQQKTGIAQPKDLSGNEVVERGNRFEPALREMYKAQHPDADVEYHAYDVLYQADRPWLAATLDGEITENGQKGVLEIKTATCVRKADYDKWRDSIPQNYYVQTLHQLLATGYDFVDVYAALFGLDDEIQIKEYRIRRAEREDDMAWLLERETDFWDRVQRGVMPAQTILI